MEGCAPVCSWTATITEPHLWALILVLSTLSTHGQLVLFLVQDHDPKRRSLQGGSPPGPRFSNYCRGLAFLAACAFTWLSSHFPYLDDFPDPGRDTPWCRKMQSLLPVWKGKPMLGMSWVLFFFNVRSCAPVIHFGGSFHSLQWMPFASDSSKI